MVNLGPGLYLCFFRICKKQIFSRCGSNQGAHVILLLLSYGTHSRFFYFQHTGITGKIGERDIITLRPNKKDGVPVIVIKTTGDGNTQGEITHRIKYMATEY